ncbi:AMP-binding protein [Fulvimonas soli]|uniref:Fatty-acyl-CoA synthase n=1 Tax=Fulvimonas soli TaxID=155197 RepID=A0A316IGQ1_9GAMM|nr:AMP-binding protein [Fulvimonas soli]PWK92269.1 fatty-acyl-CoA synthase [Fulvimonas soli]TNY26658.1 AMP-binding protein [Fulvimonas soli]
MSQPTPSYVNGASRKPLLGETVGALLDRVAAAHADRPALVVRAQGVRMDYRRFHAEVERVAAGLLALGLAPGDRVGIWAPNRAEWVLLQFAAPKAGLVLVNINPAYRLHELEYALNKVGCRALVLPRRFKTSHYLELLGELAPELAAAAPGRLRAARLPELREVILLDEAAAPGTRAWRELGALADAAAYAKLRKVEAELSFDDPVNIQFTSGTTGAPKGATLTHHNIVNNGCFIGEAMRLTERDRLCIPVPFYHCFGMVLGNLACVTHGACMVVPGEGFDALSTLETVQEERCTGLHGVPTMFIAELEHPRFGEFDLSSLRTGIMAGSPCPIEVMRRVVEEMHMAEVTIAYGMTETSPVSFQTVPDDPLERRVDSVGRVHPHLEVKLVDEAGRIVPRGEPGELCTRGYSVMRGYWGDPERTREAIDEGGWMHTGDLATLDADGYCRIVGRLKDMIIRGGENVYPREIEEFLYTHPKVRDVQVFGVPDAKFGEQVCAWVRLREGYAASEAEIQDYCRRHLAYFKVPHYVRFVESFPMTVTGKVQKYLMREAMVEELAARG